MAVSRIEGEQGEPAAGYGILCAHLNPPLKQDIKIFAIGSISHGLLPLIPVIFLEIWQDSVQLITIKAGKQ